MPSHHPPRHCFKMLNFDVSTLTVRGTFTEERINSPRAEIWDFTTDNIYYFYEFVDNPTGSYFNENVRDSVHWSSVRIS